jgi:pimeloyl-ACP methyl ester carboxylesterase
MDFTFKHTHLHGREAQYLQLNDQGIPAVFFSANGFPLGTYSEFLKPLTTKYKLSCLSPRACWPNIGQPAKQTNWEVHAEDLIAFVDQHFDDAITAIGHSQGATAIIMAASKRPELFKDLILVEPASVSKGLSLLVKTTPYAIKKQFQPFKSAETKQSTWPSAEAFFQNCRQNKAFRRIPDKVLRDYATFGLKENSKGSFDLTYSAQWEASNYALAPNVWKYLKMIKHPIHIIAGKPSLFFDQKLRQKWPKLLQNVKLEENTKFGHLYPLEAAEDCAQRILNPA